MNILKRFLGAIGLGQSTPTMMSISGVRGVPTLSKEQAMRLSTVYACVDAISSDVAKLPLVPYRVDNRGRRSKDIGSDIYHLLTLEPNPHQTRFTFLQTLVASTLLTGNGFARIHRGPNGEAKSIVYEPSDQITIYTDDSGREIVRYDSRISGPCDPSDMIHILNFSYDGVVGVSTLRHAANVLGISAASDNHAGGFFSSGGSASGILSVQVARLDKAKRDEIKREWKGNFEGDAAGLVVLDGQSSFAPITVNPKDAQLLESREFNVVEICRFFRISPVKVGDLSKSSYSTVEATNLSYLADTLGTYLEKIELEFRRKIYPTETARKRELKFDASALLRTDSSARAQLYSSLFPYGAYTTNELRDAVDLPPIAGGDEPFVMVNLQPLSRANKSTVDDTLTQQ